MSSANGPDGHLLTNLFELAKSADEDIVGELVSLFFEQSAPKHLAQLAAALAAGNVSHAATTAHSLQGASASLGSVEVAAICHRLQAQARSGDLQGIAKLMPKLEREIARAQQAFTSALTAARAASG